VLSSQPSSVSDEMDINSQRKVAGPPEPLPTNRRLRSTEDVDYASLDYSKWALSQKVLRSITFAGFQLLSRIETSGFENIPKSGSCLVAVNHLSRADVPLLLTVLQRRAIILANEKLRQSPLLNWFVSDMGQAIYVKPNELEEESLRRALTVLSAGGIVALAPEGTRSKTGGLLKGRTGIAYLATQSGAPVIPVVAWGQEKWRGRMHSLGRIPIWVRAGNPLHFPLGPASPHLLRKYTDAIMIALSEMLPSHYRGVYASSASVPVAEDPIEQVQQL
jgi:1-acyl-sn-glycerol-3-phosphate acyltransferase